MIARIKERIRHRRLRIQAWFYGTVKRYEVLPAYLFVAGALVVGTVVTNATRADQDANQRDDIRRNAHIIEILCDQMQVGNVRLRDLVVSLMQNASVETKDRVNSLLDETNPPDITALCLLATQP